MKEIVAIDLVEFSNCLYLRRLCDFFERILAIFLTETGCMMDW